MDKKLKLLENILGTLYIDRIVGSKDERIPRSSGQVVMDVVDENIDTYIEKLSKEIYEKWKIVNPEPGARIPYDVYMKDSLMGKHFKYVRMLMKQGKQIVISSIGDMQDKIPLGYKNQHIGYIFYNHDNTYWLLNPQNMESQNPVCTGIKSLDEFELML